MKVLLAIDSSPISEVVIREVAARPWPDGTTVCVLIVIDMFALTCSPGFLELFAQEETEAAEALVKRVAERLHQRAISATTRVTEGYPSTAIVDQAAQWGADLIVAGSHGHGGFLKSFIGSTARGVVHNAHCSVEIVRARKTPELPTNILLATDGSEYALAAARSIAERPWEPGTKVRIVSVADLVIPLIGAWHTSPGFFEEIRAANLSQAREALAAAETEIAGTTLESSSEVLTGSPKWRILDEAKEWGADMIVLGSHGRRGLSRLLLGSVSETVAIRADCSVEIIRAQTKK